MYIYIYIYMYMYHICMTQTRKYILNVYDTRWVLHI